MSDSFDSLDARARRARSSLTAAERSVPVPSAPRARERSRLLSAVPALVGLGVAVLTVVLFVATFWRPGAVVAPGVTAGVAAGERPAAVVTDGALVYVADAGAGRVTAYDARTLKVAWSASEAADPVALTLGDNALWVLDGSENRLLALDPRSGASVTTARTSLGAVSLAVTPGTVWVLSPSNGTLDQYDSTTVTQRGSVRVPTSSTTVTAGGGWLWVTASRSVLRVATDATRDTGVTTLPVDAEPVAVAADAASAWIALRDDRVLRISPSDPSAVQQASAVDSSPTAMTVLDGGDVVVATANGSLVRLSARASTQRLTPTGSPVASLSAHDRILVGVSPTSAELYATEVAP